MTASLASSFEHTAGPERLVSLAVRVDAVATGGLAAVVLAAAPFVDERLGISTAALYGVGAALLAYALVLELWVARRPRPALVREVIVLNLLWVVASVAVVLTDLLTLTTLGTALVLAQAAAGALLADLQYLALRRTRL